MRKVFSAFAPYAMKFEVVGPSVYFLVLTLMPMMEHS